MSLPEESLYCKGVKDVQKRGYSRRVPPERLGRKFFNGSSNCNGKVVRTKGKKSKRKYIT